MSQQVIVAIDPGRHIGVAFVSLQGELGWHTISDLMGLTALELPHNATVIVGNGTGAQQVTSVLQTRNIHYQLVEERNTSLEARQLYFADHLLEAGSGCFRPVCAVLTYSSMTMLLMPLP